MLVFGDVHGDFKSFVKAYKFAMDNNFFFMSLGDLVDRGVQPYEVVETMHYAMSLGAAGFTVGNHDDKYSRYLNGAKVRFSVDAKNTLLAVGAEREAEFLRMYSKVVNHETLSGFHHKFDDVVLVHAASHPSLWDGTAEMSKSAKSRYLVGETNGEVFEDGYPVRLYNWMDEVPIGKTLMVGHDKQPIHQVPITEPMVVTNANGGKVIFLDTGCGKGGVLSGAVVSHGKRGFKFEEFKEFK